MKECVYNLLCSDQQKGFNALHRVCYGPEGSVETLQLLLEVMPHLKTSEILNAGKNVNIHCKKYCSYSHLQCKGVITCTCFPLCFVQSKGYTMLLLACDNGNVKMVTYLLGLEEVDVSACTADGKTGLHLAAIHDYPEVAQELIQHHILLTAQDAKHVRDHSNSGIPEYNL